MNIFFREDDKNITYIVSKCTEYESVLKNQFYSLEDGNYIKSYSKDRISNIQRLKRNYTKYAEEMFLQMGYYKEVLWEQALLKFINMIQNEDIDWWLTGSCALCLRGISVEPHDVDIMLNARDLEKIKRIFGDYIVEPVVSSKGWVVNYFGVLFMEARIDLAFDPQEFVDEPDPSDFGPYAMNNLEEIDWKGKVVRIPPLKLQLEVNKRRDRNDRVKVIEEYIERNI